MPIVPVAAELVQSVQSGAGESGAGDGPQSAVSDLFTFAYINDGFDKLSLAMLREHGAMWLTACRFAALPQVRKQGETFCGQETTTNGSPSICEFCGVDVSTWKRHLDALIKLGLIENKGRDGRRRTVTLRFNRKRFNELNVEPYIYLPDFAIDRDSEIRIEGRDAYAKRVVYAWLLYHAPQDYDLPVGAENKVASYVFKVSTSRISRELGLARNTVKAALKALQREHRILDFNDLLEQPPLAGPDGGHSIAILSPRDWVEDAFWPTVLRTLRSASESAKAAA